MTKSNYIFNVIKLTPLLLFVFVWIVVVSLVQLSLYNSYSVSNESILILFYSMFIFILSYFLFVIYDKKFFRLSTSILLINEQELKKTIYVLVLLTLLGIVVKSSVIANHFGGYDIYFRNPLQVRLLVTNLDDFNLNLQLYRIGSYLSNIGLISSIYIGILYIKGKSNYIIIFLTVFIFFISSLVTFSRFIFITYLVFFFLSSLFVSLFISEDEKTRVTKKLTFLAIIILTIMASAITAIFAFRTFYSDEIGQKFTQSIYFYLSGGVIAFDNFYQSNAMQELTLGASSFRSIIKWIDALDLWPFAEALETHDDFTRVAPSFYMNTYTYIKPLIQDFGVIGMSMIVFLWAYLAKFTMKWMLEKFSIYRLYFAIIVSFSLIMSFFSFYFQAVSNIIFWLLVIILVQNFLANKVFIKPPSYSN